MGICMKKDGMSYVGTRCEPQNCSFETTLGPGSSCSKQGWVSDVAYASLQIAQAAIESWQRVGPMFEAILAEYCCLHWASLKFVLFCQHYNIRWEHWTKLGSILATNLQNWWAMMVQVWSDVGTTLDQASPKLAVTLYFEFKIDVSTKYRVYTILWENSS